MPKFPFKKNRSDSLLNKAKEVSEKLSQIDIVTIQPHNGISPKDRVIIVKKFLIANNIPHRGIFTIRQNKKSWGSQSEFDLKNKTDKNYRQAFNLLQENLGVILTALFPESFNKGCGKCNSYLLSWSGFIPNTENCTTCSEIFE